MHPRSTFRNLEHFQGRHVLNVFTLHHLACLDGRFDGVAGKLEIVAGLQVFGVHMHAGKVETVGVILSATLAYNADGGTEVLVQVMPLARLFHLLDRQHNVGIGTDLRLTALTLYHQVAVGLADVDLIFNELLQKREEGCGTNGTLDNDACR